MSETDDRLIVERGNFGTIEYAMRANGSVPAKVFLDRLSEKRRAQLAVLFRQMVCFRKVWNIEQFKHVEKKIYEFKRDKVVRVGCFQLGNRWILTHGFIKKQRRWPRSQIERASKIMKEHVEREKQGQQKQKRPR